MRRTVTMIGLALTLAGAAAAPRASEVDQRPRRSTELPRPRDPNLAVLGELDAARRAGTVAAYDLFLARHPDHPLAKVGRRERGRLLRR